MISPVLFCEECLARHLPPDLRNISRKNTFTMGSLGNEAPPVAVKLTPVLPDYYAKLKTDAKRTIDTLEESCTWGNTPDGGMSMFAF